MNALFDPVDVAPTDVTWCVGLAEALSICCIAPSDDRVGEVRDLLNRRPEQMLLPSWVELAEAAALWMENVGFADVWRKPRPNFPGIRAIEAALRDMPVPVPAWAERYQ